MKKPVQIKKNLEELKRSEGKLSRCVSRGGAVSNNSSLLDQVAPTKGFEKRAQYYAAKAYSRQLSSGQEEDGKYQNLKEVIFIAIADCIIFKDKTEYKSDHVILDKNSHEHDLQDFSFTFIELPKFKKTNISELNTILEKWSRC